MKNKINVVALALIMSLGLSININAETIKPNTTVVNTVTKDVNSMTDKELVSYFLDGKNGEKYDIFAGWTQEEVDRFFELDAKYAYKDINKYQKGTKAYDEALEYGIYIACLNWGDNSLLRPSNVSYQIVPKHLQGRYNDSSLTSEERELASGLIDEANGGFTCEINANGEATGVVKIDDMEYSTLDMIGIINHEIKTIHIIYTNANDHDSLYSLITYITNATENIQPDSYYKLNEKVKFDSDEPSRFHLTGLGTSLSMHAIYLSNFITKHMDVKNLNNRAYLDFTEAYEVDGKIVLKNFVEVVQTGEFDKLMTKGCANRHLHQFLVDSRNLDLFPYFTISSPDSTLINQELLAEDNYYPNKKLTREEMRDYASKLGIVKFQVNATPLYKRQIEELANNQNKLIDIVLNDIGSYTTKKIPEGYKYKR